MSVQEYQAALRLISSFHDDYKSHSNTAACKVRGLGSSGRYCWRCECSEMLRRVGWYNVTDFSNDRIAVIFRVKQPRTWRLERVRSQTQLCQILTFC